MSLYIATNNLIPKLFFILNIRLIGVNNTQNKQSTRRKSSSIQYSEDSPSIDECENSGINENQQTNEISEMKTSEEIERERQIQIEDEFHQKISNYV